MSHLKIPVRNMNKIFFNYFLRATKVSMLGPIELLAVILYIGPFYSVAPTLSPMLVAD